MGVLAVAALLACVRVGERPHVAGIPITAEGRSKLGGSSTHSLTTLAFSLSVISTFPPPSGLHSGVT